MLVYTQAFIALVTLIATGINTIHANENGFKDLFALSLKELANIQLTSGSTLVSTSLRNQPAAVTYIPAYEITQSGALTVDDLLEIYVPGMQMLQTTFYGRTIGFRGIQLKRPEQYLLMVNGQASNFRIFDGAVNDRELPLMGDIHDVTVIRGPSSFLYGPGAETATINLTTYDGFSFQGTQLESQYNATENLSTLEISHGVKFNNNQALYIYAGAANYEGADYKDAPIYFGHSFETYWGQVNGSKPADFIGLNGVLGYPDPQYKVFARYDHGNFNIWFRFNDEGVRNPESWAKLQHGEANNLSNIYGWHTANDTENIQRILNESNLEARKSKIAVMNYLQQIDSQWSIDYKLAYHWSEYRWHRGWDVAPLEYRENIYRDEGHTQAKALVSWKSISGKHSLAFGGEVIKQPFSGKRWIVGGDQVTDNGEWTTYTRSLLIDYHWSFNQDLSIYAGSRVDNHSYMDSMWSPRLAAVYQTSESDSIKLIAARSVRKPMEILMRIDRMNDTKYSFDPEKFGSMELRWERQHNEKWAIANSVVYEQIEAFDASLSGDQDQVGKFDIGVYEFEAFYKTDSSSLTFSHSYSTLLNAQQNPDVAITTLTVADAENPIGNKLAFWSDHITKLAWNKRLTQSISYSTSIIHYWGFDGIEDFSQWVTENAGTALPTGADRRYGHYDGTNTHAADSNTYINLGLQWQPYHELSIRLDSYNLNEFFNSESSKRNYIGSGAGSYQIEPASIQLKVTLKTD